jgi:hypothetical protein
VQLQILQLIAGCGRDEVAHKATRQRAEAKRKEKVMYVISIHSVSDPQAFWGGQLDLPEGTELPFVAPSSDGSRGVCVFKSDSVNTVKSLVDGATGAISKNEYFVINEGNAQGLPA